MWDLTEEREQRVESSWVLQRDISTLRSAAWMSSGAFALEQRREFRATFPKENTPLFVGVSIAAIAFTGAKVVSYFEKPANEVSEAGEPEPAGKGKEAGSEKKKESDNSLVGWLNYMLGKKFYEGGFESEMTKREAALILGIRESAPKDKVREAHRRLSRLNHPDVGGSPLVSQKVNEAKDKLLNSN